MAQLMTINLNKGDSPNLGFRLQGGVDFAAPLVIQKVNGGSPADRSGLQAGDAVIKINNTDVYSLRHKDAQDVIINAGPSFTITVQRGGSTWKPSVTPVGSVGGGGAINNVSPVTKTSLAAKPQPSVGAIGTGHNVSAKPFLNGTANGGPKLVNKQYNSPIGIYSEQSIAETLSAQSEVLSTGVLGVNFKKNEKNYDATKSAVYHMLQEAEREPRDSEPDQVDFGVSNSPSVGGQSGLKHVQAPENKPAPPPPSNPQLPPGQNICADCERLIVGVFVRIKDKNLHVECFKCSTCGASLKNVGYYNINNKLYCDIHAKLAAKSNAPAPNLVPVTVPPGGRAPAGAISAALASHSLPTPGPLSPKIAPLSPKTGPVSPSANITATPFQANFSSAPRPFSSVTAPLSPNTYSRPLPNTPVGPPPPVVQAPAPAPAPVLPPAPAPATTPDKGRSLQNIAWPPTSEDPNHLPTASPLYFPPPEVVKACEARIEQQLFESSCADSCSITFESEGRSSRRSQAEQYDQDYCDLEDYTNTIRAMEAKMSLCSSEVCDITGRRSAMECAETIAEHLQTQMLVENVMKSRPKSPPPYNPKKASIVPTAAPITTVPQTQGPKLESVENPTCPPAYLTPPQTEAPALPVTKPVCPPACPKSCCNESCETSPIQAPADLPRLQEYQKHEALKLKIQNAVPQKYETPMVAALTTAPVKKFSTLGSDPFSRIPQRHSTSALTDALSTAPVEPFNPVLSVFTTLEPVPLPEETVPYLPPEHPFVPVEPKAPKKEPPKPSSPFVETLKIAPDRPFTPVGAPIGVMKKQQLDPLLKDLPKPQEHISLLAALTTAPDEPIAHLVPDVVAVQKCTPEQTKQQQVKKLLEERKSSIKQPVPQPFISAMVGTFEGSPENVKTSSFPPVSIDLQQVKQGQQLQETKLLDKQGGYAQKQEYHEERSFVGEQQQHVQVQQYHEERKHFGEEHQRIQMQEYHEEKTVVKEQQKQEYHAETKVVGEQFIKGQVARQAEEIVYKKPLNLAGSLHKTQQLPQYQATLEYDQELQLPHHKNIGKLLEANTKSKIVPSSRPLLRAEPSHTRTPPPQITKPITTIQPGCHTNQQNTFQPVNEDFKAPTCALPQRVPSRPLTPSMINKPPSVIPYYQQNLVAQEYLAPEVNMYDPKSPGVSRSPSPCPGGERPSSPWRPRTPRPKSPAAGPPPNPLKMHNGDAPKPTRALTPQPQPETFRQKAAVQDYQKHQSNHIGDVSVSISEKGRHEHAEALMKSQSIESLGNVQVQRRKVVTEEFESTHKEKNVEIATKGHPFRNVNVPPDNDHQGIIGLHVTNPHPIVSPFLNMNVGPVAPRPVPVVPQQRPAVPAVQPAPVPPPAKFTPPVPPISAASSTSQRVKPGVIPVPSVGGGAGDRGRQAGGNVFQPRRGRGVLNAGGLVGARIPVCGACSQQVRGPFITALGKIWCPDHFVCATTSCRRPLQDIGFVEERGQLHCEYCFERYLAPDCAKCAAKIKGDCLKAIGKNFHPECFACAYCNKLFGNSPFFLEDGLPYCEADWNEMFTTKCFACGFPVEAGDRWVEALNNNYHSQCFNCTMCKKNLEGQSFFAKGGRPFCKNHAR